MANIRRLMSVVCALIAALVVVSGTATSTVLVPRGSGPAPVATAAPTQVDGNTTQFDTSTDVGAEVAVSGGSTGANPQAQAEPTASPSALPVSARTIWTFDIYDTRAPRFQDPDMTACTAAATVSMLNTIAYTGADPTLVWKPNRSFGKQEAILSYERAHMTMLRSSAGTDPHGWRNALNYFGWGRADAGVYRDVAYDTINRAEAAVVMAIARYHKPVGITTQWGQHAEFVTGYKVQGQDPRTGSLDWHLLGVYVTDPWRRAYYANFYLTQDRWETGWSWYRFSPYLQVDSPYRDRLDGQVGRTEWYSHWVTLEPTR